MVSIPIFDSHTAQIIEKTRENFIKQLVWSPDGKILIASSEDNFLISYATHPNLNTLQNISLPETIHDFSPYPWMSFDNPNTALVVVAGRELPLRLFNILQGQEVSTFLAYPPLSMSSESCYSLNCCAFSPDGALIFAGEKRFLYCFDAWTGQVRPRQVWKHQLRGPMSTCTSRKDSSFIMAGGSFSGSIALYDHRIAEPLIMKLPNEHQEGISQLQFSLDGWSLFSAARRESTIRQWDLRKEVTVLKRFSPRPSSTYQRLYFAQCHQGDCLWTGDQEGNLLGFKINSQEESPLVKQVVTPGLPVNSVAINQQQQIALACGQRVFASLVEEDEDDDDDGGDDDDDDDGDGDNKDHIIDTNRTGDNGYGHVYSMASHQLSSESTPKLLMASLSSNVHFDPLPAL